MNAKEKVILRRLKRLVVVTDASNHNPMLAQALQANIVSLGFLFSAEALRQLAQCDERTLVTLNESLPAVLLEMKGGNFRHVPLFRDFPDGVPEDNVMHFFKRLEALYTNFFGGSVPNAVRLNTGLVYDAEAWDMSNYGGDPITGRAMTDEELADNPAKPRPALDPTKDGVTYDVIELADVSDQRKLLHNLIHTNTPLSQADMADILTLAEGEPEALRLSLSEPIAMRENAALMVAHCFDAGYNDTLQLLVDEQLKSATDVLRVAVVMSSGDVSLSKPTRFVKFARAKRRFLLNALESVSEDVTDLLEDMVRWREPWVKLAHGLHVGDYATVYPTAFRAVDMLRRKDYKGLSFASRVEAALSEGDADAALAMLKSRPGELGRRLDQMLSMAPDATAAAQIVEVFASVADKMPTTMLSLIRAHFSKRHVETSEQRIRAFFPKGNTSKAWVTSDKRKVLSAQVCDSVVKIAEDALLSRFAEMDNLGAVHVDSRLRDFPVPFSQRAASVSLHTVPKGSRIDLPDNEVIRLFIHWADLDHNAPAVLTRTTDKKRVDLDLTASMYDENWTFKGQVSYTNYTNMYAKHSGDLTSAPLPRGATEFIDFKPDTFSQNGARYLVMQVYSFTGQQFGDLQRCFAGFMGVNDAEAGQHFEPMRVKWRFDVRADARAVMPLIFDCKERKAIWTDVGLYGRTLSANFESSAGKVCELGIAMSQAWNDRPDMFTLAALHAAARGKNILVTDGEREIYVSSKGKTKRDVLDQIIEFRGDDVEDATIIEAIRADAVTFALHDADYTPYSIESVSAELLK